MTGSRHILVGAFFVLVLSILGYFTLFMTEFSLFKDSYPLVVHFSDANGLRQGDSVLIAGIRKGRVLDLVFDPAAPLERRITVNLKIDEPVELREGFSISIEDATLLGGKQIYIDPGPAEGGVVASDASLLGNVSGNALAGIGDVIDENRDAFARIVSGLDLIVTDVRGERGVVGRLISNEALAASFTSGVEGFRTTVDNTALISQDLRDGKGTLGKLLTEEQVYDRLTEIADNLAEASIALNTGQGTLGRLINDDKLYVEVEKAIGVVTRSLEEYREAAPITTFTSVLFGGF